MTLASMETAPLRIGMTGGPACGKSMVSEMLARQGWNIIETDRLAHQAYAVDGPAYKNVVDAFGPSILNPDRSVNRSILGGIVFANPDSLRLLNSILHPWIRNEWQKQLERHHRNQPSVPSVVVIPLLFETEAEASFDRIIGVGCPADLQRQRLLARGLNQEAVTQRIDSQLPLQTKLNRSHMIIWNSGSLAFLGQQVQHLSASLS